MEKRIVNFLPALMAGTISFVAWVNLLIIAGAKQIQLNKWRVPDWIVIIFIIAAINTLLPYNICRIVGTNVLIMTCIVYFFQGMAIIGYFFSIRGWGHFTRGIIYVLILSQIYIMILVSGLGLFDTWFEFRKRIKPTIGDHK
jgi:uncharacterized protein YybS (DUF2232 family)